MPLDDSLNVRPASRLAVTIAIASSTWLFPAAVPADAQTPAVPTFSMAITESTEIVEDIGTTRRVSRADIDARQARTLDDALRLLPGVYIRTGGDGTPRIDIRGFRSRHVLLLIDGVPFNSTADGQFDPARISTEGVREIKVSYGSSSVLYGDNAMAAVIEIVTEPAASNRASADLVGGTPDLRDGSAHVTRTIGGVSVLLAGSAAATTGYRLPGSFVPTSVEHGGRRDNSDRARRELRGKVAYAASPALTVATEWTIGGGSYGVPPSTIADAADVFAQAVRFDRVDDYRTLSGQASAAYTPAGGVDVRGWVYRNHQREDAARYDDATYSSMDDPLVAGTFRSRDETTVTGSTLLARLDLARAGALRLAVNQRRDAFDSAGVIRDVAPAGSGGGGGTGGGGGGGDGRGRPQAAIEYGVRDYATRAHVDVYSTGGEWQFRPTRRLGAVVGGSANWQQRPDAGADAEPAWIAGLTYDMTAATRLHASATRKIRFPSIDQFYNVSSGNLALRPERSVALDAGVDHTVATATTVGVSIFSTRASNFIEREQGGPFSNRDRYRFSGAEAVVETRAIRGVDVRAAYNFLSAVDLGGGGGAELQYRPRHRASLDAAWRFATAWSARATVYGVADQRYYSRGTVPVQARAGDYTLADAMLTRSLGRHYEATLRVTNLFDTRYEQSYGLPREGRAAQVGLRVRFE